MNTTEASNREDTPAGWDAGSTQTNGASIFHVSVGEGEPVVLIHGGFQTWRCWRRVMELLSDSYRAVAVDLRGVGRSETSDGSFDQVSMADDVAEVMAQLGHERYHVVGHDLGAAVATTMAALHANHVDRLVFAEYLLCGYGFEQALAPRPDNHHFWFASLNMIPDIPEMLIAGHERQYLTYLSRVALTANPEAIEQTDLDDYIETYSEPGRWHALCEMFRATWQNADTNIGIAARSRISLPALAVGGAYSAADECARSLSNLADEVVSVVLDGAGHWLPEEKPEEFTQHLKSFFRSYPGAALDSAG